MSETPQNMENASADAVSEHRSGERPSASSLAYKGSLAGLKGLLSDSIGELALALGQSIEKKISHKNEIPGSSRIAIEFLYPCPDQPRQFFDPKSLEELAATLESVGQAQAITVRRTPKGYEIIAGERRFRAAKLAGLSHLDCVVKDCSREEARLLALVENTQRQDLCPIEEAQFLSTVIAENPGMTLDKLAKNLGSHKSTLSEKIKLCEVSEKAIQLLYTNKGRYLTHRHWRIISRLKDEVQRDSILAQAVDEQLSVLDLENLVAGEFGVESRKKRKSKRHAPTQDSRVASDLQLPIFELKKDKQIQIKPNKFYVRQISEQLRFQIIGELEYLIELLRR